MKFTLKLLALLLSSFIALTCYADDELSPATPVVPNIAPEPPTAPPATNTSPIPGNLEGLAESCHADLNAANNDDTQLQQILAANATDQAVTLLTNTDSCRIFSEKAVVTFVILSPHTNPILRGGIALNSPLTPAAPAFPTQICHALCTYSCRPSVGIIFSLVALGHGCAACSTTNNCTPASLSSL